MKIKNSIEDVFPILNRIDLKELPVINKPVVIFCISPRTGSTALCSMLNKIPSFFYIEEFFNPRGPIQHFNNGEDFGEYLESIANLYNKKFFSFKVAWTDFTFLAKDSRFKTIFPDRRFIYIDRFDSEAQAISLFHSIKSKVWHHKKDELESPLSLTDDDFDLTRILQCLNKIKIEKLNWHQFFFNNDISYLHLHYEFFEKNMLLGVEKILSHLDIEADKAKLESLESEYVKKEKAFYNDWLTKFKYYRSEAFYKAKTSDP